jgi:hypothetical protein
MSHTIRTTACLVLTAALASAALPAQAKDDPDPATPPPVFQAVIDCKVIADPTARLACYDKAVSAMDAAREAKDLVIADRSTMREAKRGLFGLSLPKLKLFGGSDSEEVSEVESTISAISRGRDGYYVFTLQDGARWKQTEGRDTFPKVGQSIKIRKAMMGSFMANVNDRTAIRVVRLAN